MIDTLIACWVKISADNILIGDNLHEMSKCQILFSGKSMYSIANLSSAELA